LLCLGGNGGGVGRTNRKLQSIAQERSHFLVLREDFEGGLPPPGRRRRSFIHGYAAPLRKLVSGPLN
jgi:hypothetical protein